jgi:hypothetical protein
MRRLVFAVTVSAGLMTLGACASLGERSTLAELKERCDARGGELTPGNSAAEGGYRCTGVTINAASASAQASHGRAMGQMSRAVERSLAGRGPGN